jgi:hypothetical protein
MVGKYDNYLRESEGLCVSINVVLFAYRAHRMTQEASGKWRECSTVFSAKGGKSARTIGIDLAGLHKMAPEAGDVRPLLVIQAISKKSSLRVTSISRLEKATGKIGTGAPPRIAVHHSADFPPFARDFGRSTCGFGNAPGDLRDVCFLTPCWL